MLRDPQRSVWGGEYGEDGGVLFGVGVGGFYLGWGSLGAVVEGFGVPMGGRMDNMSMGGLIWGLCRRLGVFDKC